MEFLGREKAFNRVESSCSMDETPANLLESIYFADLQNIMGRWYLMMAKVELDPIRVNNMNIVNENDYLIKELSLSNDSNKTLNQWARHIYHLLIGSSKRMMILFRILQDDKKKPDLRWTICVKSPTIVSSQLFNSDYRLDHHITIWLGYLYCMSRSLEVSHKYLWVGTNRSVQSIRDY